jgi:hypothetical protein
MDEVTKHLIQPPYALSNTSILRLSSIPCIGYVNAKHCITSRYATHARGYNNQLFGETIRVGLMLRKISRRVSF